MLITAVVQLLSGILNTAVWVVLLTFKQILNAPGCGFMERWHLLKRQQGHSLVVYKTQILFLKLEVIQRLITAGEDNEQHVVTPLFFELCECEDKFQPLDRPYKHGHLGWP